MADGRRVCRIGCRSGLDLGNPESSALEFWAIIQNLVLGPGTLVAAEFGRAELENEFHFISPPEDVFSLSVDIERRLNDAFKIIKTLILNEVSAVMESSEEHVEECYAKMHKLQEEGGDQHMQPPRDAPKRTRCSKRTVAVVQTYATP